MQNTKNTRGRKAFTRKPLKHQRGYLIISTMIALPVIALIGVMIFEQQMRAAHIGRNTAEGSQAAQFAVGLRGYIATIQQDLFFTPPASIMGVDWLKSPSCGGQAGNPDEGFVPCTYTGGTYGHLYETQFTRDTATNFIEARTHFVLPPHSGDPKTVITAAERVVQGALANQTLPANGMFFTAFANTAIDANAPEDPSAINAANYGRVLMVASNSPSNDIWLRTDGTNIMQANINLGGNSIENARDARFSGDVRIDNRLHVEHGITTSEIHVSAIDKFVSEGVYYAETFSGSTTVPKPNCSQAGNNPAIYVATQSLGQLPDSDTVMWTASIDVDSGWNVTPRIQGVKFDIEWNGSTYVLTKQEVSTTSPPGFRYMVMTRCR